MREDPDDDFFLFSDFIAWMKEKRKALLIGAALFALLGGIAALFFPPKYRARAVFREVSLPYAGSEGKTALSHWLVSSGIAPSQNEGAALMATPEMLQEVVALLGMQVQVDAGSLWTKVKENMWDLVCAEMRRCLPERDRFAFRAVSYEGKEKQKYFLVFLTGEQFEVQNADHTKIAYGEVGKEVVCDQMTFTLKSTPRRVKLLWPYKLTLNPLVSTAKTLSQDIQVSRLDNHPSILKISFAHRNRDFAREVLNEAMKRYRRHLEKEHEEMTQDQLSYLTTRQKRLEQVVDQEWEAYALYLKQNLASRGFFTMKQELEHTLDKRRRHKDRLLEMDLEEGRLRQASLDFSTNDRFVTSILALQKEAAILKKKRHQLALEGELALGALPAKQAQSEAHALAKAKKERLYQAGRPSASAQRWGKALFGPLFPYTQRRDQKTFIAMSRRLLLQRSSEDSHFLQQEVRKLLLEIEAASAPFTFEQWQKRLQKVLPGSGVWEKKEELVAALRSFLNRLRLEEAVRKEERLYPADKQKDFAGVDLSGVEALYAQYVAQRDRDQEEIKRLTIAQQELIAKNSEFSALSALLKDARGQKLARELSELNQSLRNERHFGMKECQQMRYLKEKKREELKSHISQALALHQKEVKRLNQKISEAARTCVALLNRSIALIKREVAQKTESELAKLSLERELIQCQLGELKDEMKVLPDHWLKEQRLHFNAELSLNMVEIIAQSIESKNAEHHLAMVRSKPLTPAMSAAKPRYPFLLLFTSLAALLGFLITWGALLLRHSRDIPLTWSNLALRGYPLFEGVVGATQEGVRRLFLFVQQHGGVMAMLLQKTSPLISALTPLLARAGRSVCVISLDEYDKSCPDSPGLFSFLMEGKEKPRLVENNQASWIFWGGPKVAQTELLQTARFSAYLDELRRAYSCILLVSSALPEEARAEGLLFVADHILIAGKNYKRRQLAPYFSWEKEKKERHLGFLQ